MNFRLLAVLLSICLSGHEAKRVEVKTSKERPLGRHFAKQQIQGNTDSLIESDSQPLTAGKNAQASEDELVTDFVPSTEEPGVPPASAPAQKVAGVNSSPVKSRGSFLSSIVGSLFGSNQVAASKLASGTGEKDAFSSAPASTSESSCASETETALGVPQASGADTVHVTSAAGSGRAAEVSAEGDATAAPPRASAEDAERALAMDLERRRQTLMHKQKLEIAEMEVKKLKEVEEEIQRKKNAAEADLKASLEAGARQAQDVESELSRMRAQTEVELAETVAAQRRSMNEIKQMELQKLRDLDEEVEKKRVAAEAFMNQSMQLREMELALRQREDELDLLKLKLQEEAQDRKRAIDELIAQRLKDYENEIEIRRMAADKTIKAQEQEAQLKLARLDEFEQERLRQSAAEVSRMMEEAEAIAEARRREANELMRQTKEYEAIALANVEAKLQATRRINETLIKEIEIEAKKKAKETERIESQRRMEFEDEIERRRLVINELVQQVELETENKRKSVDAELAAKQRDFEFALERKRSAMEHELEQFNVTMERKWRIYNDAESKRIREVEDDIQQRRVAAEAQLQAIESQAENQRRNLLQSEKSRLAQFDEELQRRHNAAEAIMKELDKQIEDKRQALSGLEEFGLLEIESEVEKRRVVVNDLIRTIEKEVETKRQIASELEAERSKEFEYDLLRRREAADAELNEIQRKSASVHRELADLRSTRLREIEDELSAMRTIADVELQSVKSEVIGLRREMEEFRSSQMHEIESSALRQQQILTDLVTHLESEAAEREKLLEKNHSQRVHQFEEEFEKKRLEAEQKLKEMEVLWHRRQFEANSNLEREIAAATKQLVILEHDIENRKKSIVELESSAHLLMSERIAVFEVSIIQRHKELDEEIEERRAAARLVIEAAQVEAEAIRRRSMEESAAELESKIIASMDAERSRRLSQFADLEMSYLNETKKVRDMEFELSRLETRNIAIERDLGTIKSQYIEVDTDRTKCAARYKELQEITAVHLKQVMTLEDEHQFLFLQLKNCEIGVSTNSTPVCMETEQRLKLAEEKSRRLGTEIKMVDSRCDEVKAADKKRIGELETDLHNSLFAAKALEVKEDYKRFEVEISKNNHFESELLDCSLRFEKCEGLNEEIAAKMHNLELELRRVSEINYNCEIDKTSLHASLAADSSKVIRDLEFDKSQIAAKLKEREKTFDAELRKQKDVGKELTSCKDKVSSLLEDIAKYSARANQLDQHVKKLVQANKDFSVESKIDSEVDKIFVLDLLQTWWLYLTEFQAEIMLLVYASCVFILSFFGYKLVFMCWGLLSSPQVMNPQVIETSTGATSAQNFNSSQNRIFGRMHMQSNDVPATSRNVGQPLTAGESQSALVGRLKRIMNQEEAEVIKHLR